MNPTDETGLEQQDPNGGDPNDDPTIPDNNDPDQLMVGDDGEAEYDREKTYWAAWRGDDLIDAITERERAYFCTARNRGLWALWVIAYAAHHGLTPQDLRDFATQQIGFEGNELELIRFHLNLTRSYVLRQSIMALGEAPAFKAMVVNTDHQSQAKAELADKIVNALYRRYVEDHDLEVAEGDGVFGSAASHFRWDFKGGDTVTVQAPVMEPDVDIVTGELRTDEMGKPLQRQKILPPDGKPATHPVKTQSGAPVVTTIYPWSLVTETRASGEPLWVMVREQESKWSVAANFPKYRDEILATQNTYDEWDFSEIFRLQELEFPNKDLCTIRHFYHRRDASMPEGRYVVVMNRTIIWDGPCPTKDGVPVALMRSSVFIETNFGYGDSWDMLAINQALNQVNSDEILNYANYGRQTTYAEKGSNITNQGLVRGTHYEIPSGARPPGAVNLVAIPDTLPKLKEYLHQQLDHTSGQNATARGDPDNNVRSGEMAALLDSTAIRYQSFRQQSARKYRIRGATIILDMIRRYSETPFLVDISGVKDRSYVSEFVKDDISGVERVTLDVVSPMMQTVAGRLQMFMNLKDLAPDQRAAAYELIVSGDPSLFMSKERNTEMLIRRENEDLVTDERPVFPTAGEDAMRHYQGHWDLLEQILASDDQDQEVIKRIQDHLSATVQVWLGSSPLVAGLRMIQPPPALPPSPANEFGNPAYQLAALMAGAPAPAPGTTGGPGQPPTQEQQGLMGQGQMGPEGQAPTVNMAGGGQPPGPPGGPPGPSGGGGGPPGSPTPAPHPSGTPVSKPSTSPNQLQ